MPRFITIAGSFSQSVLAEHVTSERSGEKLWVRRATGDKFEIDALVAILNANDDNQE